MVKTVTGIISRKLGIDLKSMRSQQRDSFAASTTSKPAISSLKPAISSLKPVSFSSKSVSFSSKVNVFGEACAERRTSSESQTADAIHARRGKKSYSIRKLIFGVLKLNRDSSPKTQKQTSSSNVSNAERRWSDQSYDKPQQVQISRRDLNISVPSGNHTVFSWRDVVRSEDLQVMCSRTNKIPLDIVQQKSREIVSQNISIESNRDSSPKTQKQASSSNVSNAERRRSDQSYDKPQQVQISRRDLNISVPSRNQTLFSWRDVVCSEDLQVMCSRTNKIPLDIVQQKSREIVSQNISIESTRF